MNCDELDIDSSIIENFQVFFFHCLQSQIFFLYYDRTSKFWFWKLFHSNLQACKFFKKKLILEFLVQLQTTQSNFQITIVVSCNLNLSWRLSSFCFLSWHCLFPYPIKIVAGLIIFSIEFTTSCRKRVWEPFKLDSYKIRLKITIKPRQYHKMNAVY